MDIHEENYYKDIERTFTKGYAAGYRSGYSDGVRFIIDIMNDKKVERVLNEYIPAEWLFRHKENPEL